MNTADKIEKLHREHMRFGGNEAAWKMAVEILHDLQRQLDAILDRTTQCDCCGGYNGEHYPNCLDFPPAKTEQEQSISPGDYISTSAGSRELRIHNTGEQTIHVAFDAEPEQEQDNLREYYVTTAELADREGVTRGTVFAAIKRGELKAIWGKSYAKGKPGGSRSYLIHPKEAARWSAWRFVMGRQWINDR